MERTASAVETWTDITGDSYEAAAVRRIAYDRWFSICTCGHGPENHASGGGCSVKRCECGDYDHITGKPDHPCNPLSAKDPRRKQEREQVLEEALGKVAEVCESIAAANATIAGEAADEGRDCDASIHNGRAEVARQLARHCRDQIALAICDEELREQRMDEAQGQGRR